MLHHEMFKPTIHQHLDVPSMVPSTIIVHQLTIRYSSMEAAGCSIARFIHSILPLHSIVN
jgi:hypothetical protein